MGNNKEIILSLIIAMILITGALFFSVPEFRNYFSNYELSNNNVSTHPVRGEPYVPYANPTASAKEQLVSLETTKAGVLVPRIVIPAIPSENSITQIDLPKYIFITSDATDVKASTVVYADKTAGYKIKYSINKNWGSAQMEYLAKSRDNSFKLTWSVQSNKASLMDFEGSEAKMHVTFLETGDTETEVSISTISKLK